jgi:hypothetical protein
VAGAELFLIDKQAQTIKSDMACANIGVQIAV